MGTVPATAIANGGTISFTGLTQSIPVGNTYFFITADVAAGAITNNTVIVPANPTVTFTSGTVTNNITLAGTQTISVPSITLDNGTSPSIAQTVSSGILQSSTGNILSDFRANVGIVTSTLNTLSFTAGGTFTAGDFTNFYLYANTKCNYNRGNAYKYCSRNCYWKWGHC